VTVPADGAAYARRVAAGRRLVLASASPARLATLRAAGIEPEAVVSGVDEDGVDGGSPSGTALLLARRKAQAVANRLGADRLHVGQELVLGCDSVFELDGQAYGKPLDAADAAARWRQMRGRSGVLHTGHHLVDLDSDREVGAIASTLVTFADVTEAEIEAYVATGEPLRVAGGFTLDGLGGPFVRSVEGDPHTVVGLSLPLLRILLADLDIPWPSLWA
jgi:septum formation protein